MFFSFTVFCVRVCVCAFRAPPNDCQPCLHTQHTKRFILYTRAHSDSKRSLGDGSSTGKNICVEVRRRRVAPAMSQPNEKLCTTKTQMLFLAFRSNGIQSAQWFGKAEINSARDDLHHQQKLIRQKSTRATPMTHAAAIDVDETTSHDERSGGKMPA